ncbi:MAG TPA: penicillin acylase family protein, partial [Candidatus Dormibacteraeota bacterium]|nr:penicillin acylase family protein [Candidatus Dormibacteraeota bacterium]
AGPLPALGPAFNPISGAWTMAADAAVSNETLRLAGLQQPVKVTLEGDGTTHVVAQTDHDLFLATGYTHARFRLFQMDLLRRQGEGRLSEVFGKAALDSDRFELQLGLLRTAQLEWSSLAPDNRSRLALVAYAQGVNDRIAEDESKRQLPAMFTLVGYRPKPWTPIDTLIVKGDMTQTLNFTDTPLVMALLNKALGPDLTAQWFPILPPNPQSPYDLGPYPVEPAIAPIAAMSQVTDAAAVAAADAYQRLASLPAGLIATGGASNNWAVAGSKSTSGGAMMAGDPHLHLTLPAIWFQLTQDSPSYHTSGVSIPGTPGVLIGHNQHIAWSLTDAQNQQTFFYLEHEDSAHPGQYLWKGDWQRYKTVGYDIPVLGGSTEHLTVRLSVHGPVISERGQTTSVWWAGNIPSQDLDVLIGINQASDYQSFREALRGWYSPTHNFVYADDKGNIGLISAGYYPQINGGQPWLPMPGTGEYDVTGTIPYDDIPQSYNPPGGIIWSANQRQVNANYPYYIGTASNFFNPGYRANEIYRVLSQSGKLSAADMMALQTDTRDYLASEIVPILLHAIPSSPSKDLLMSWDYGMEINSPAATIWWTFWQTYIAQSFDPWWKAKKVTVNRSELNGALGQDLEAMTIAGTTVCPPGGCQPGALTAAVNKAFRTTVATLTNQLGSDPSKWTWGKVHQRVIQNLAQITGLNYGPRPDRGDANTPLAAPDFPSTHGPSWRMVVDWGAGTFQAIYPGGQSENPASQWYENRVDKWFNGQYADMLTADQAASSSGSKTWSLKP